MPALSWRLGVRERIPPLRARPPATAIESCTLGTARLLAMLSRHSQLARCASVRTHAPPPSYREVATFHTAF